jgi:hypothetical protein
VVIVLLNHFRNIYEVQSTANKYEHINKYLKISGVKDDIVVASRVTICNRHRIGMYNGADCRVS